MRVIQTQIIYLFLFNSFKFKKANRFQNKVMSTGRRSGGESERKSRGSGGPINRLLPPRDRRSDDRHNPAPSLMSVPISEMPPGRGMAVKFSGQAFSDAELLNDIPKKKFTGRCRLFVGNLPIEMKEPELKELFTPHGEIAECYLSGKGFAFLRLDTRAHAESAKEALDGKLIKNRQIRVRYAVHGATIKIKELSPVVSNEMLHLTFSAFGDVERAIHIVDEKGKPTGEGIVEFERKVSAQEALAQIRERVFLLTANSRPLQAEMLEPKDEEDGLSEKMIQKTHHLIKERELGPRFAAMHSFEYVYGRRWKELYEYEQKRRAELEAELREQRRRLDADMEVEYEDYKTQMLREELQRRQEELERLEASRQMRRQQQQQMMGGMMGGWEPQLVDGPLGRNMPPTFGPASGHPRPMMGGGPMPGLGIGGMPLPIGGGAQSGPFGPPLRGDEQHDRDAGAGMGEIQNGRGPSPQGGPDVRKLLQGFRDSPHSGRPQLPPGLMGLLDRNQNPLSAFLSPGRNSPAVGVGGIGVHMPGGGVEGAAGPPPPPPGPGGRIPPPPPPMGGAHPMPQLMGGPRGGNANEFPPDKKSRHG